MVAGPRPVSLARRVAFALLTLVLLVGLTEIGLRSAGLPGSPDRTTTWFADHILHPPLVRHKRVFHPRAHFFTPGQASQFHPFGAERAEKSLRVAVLGGSAAHGYGVLEPAAFPHLVELLLQEALPEREVQVINFGTIAWLSQQLLWAARQLWDLGSWDLLIIYSGHNELLELSSWKTYLTPSAHRRLTRALLWSHCLKSSRLVALLRNLVQAAAPSAAEPERSEGLEDPNLLVGLDPVAMAPAHRLEELSALPVAERAQMGPFEWDYAAATFEHNMSLILQEAEANDTPVLLISPPANDLQDPIGFSPAGVRGEELEEKLSELGARMDRGQLELMEGEARKLVESYRDPRAMYLLAQALRHRGAQQEALHWYEQARAFTEYPSRIVPAVRERILSLRERPGVLAVLDAEARFREHSEDGVIGYDLIYDHCHPSVEGHRLLAQHVVAGLFDAEFLPLREADKPDLERWLSEEAAAAEARAGADPRLWRWDGRSFEEGQHRYLSSIPGGFKTVRRRLEEVAEAPGASAMHWLRLGNARFYDYDLAGALAAFEKSLSIDPSLCVAWANSAYALRSAGAREAALRPARRARDCAPTAVEFAAQHELLERLLAN